MLESFVCHSNSSMTNNGCFFIILRWVNKTIFCELIETSLSLPHPPQNNYCLPALIVIVGSAQSRTFLGAFFIRFQM